jgi:glutaredoxin
LILSGFGAVALSNDIKKFDSKTIDYENRDNEERGNSYTHTILGEFGTATWCGYCKFAHAALKNIYAGGWHPFYYVSLVCDKNTHGLQREHIKSK